MENYLSKVILRELVSFPIICIIRVRILDIDSQSVSEVSIKVVMFMLERAEVEGVVVL